MQSSSPVTVNTELNNNNLVDERKPLSWTDITQGGLTQNCLTWPNITGIQSGYLTTFWEGRNDQKVCTTLSGNNLSGGVCGDTLVN